MGLAYWAKVTGLVSIILKHSPTAKNVGYDNKMVQDLSSNLGFNFMITTLKKDAVNL